MFPMIIQNPSNITIFVLLSLKRDTAPVRALFLIPKRVFVFDLNDSVDEK